MRTVVSSDSGHGKGSYVKCCYTADLVQIK